MCVFDMCVSQVILEVTHNPKGFHSKTHGPFPHANNIEYKLASGTNVAVSAVWICSWSIPLKLECVSCESLHFSATLL